MSHLTVRAADAPGGREKEWSMKTSCEVLCNITVNSTIGSCQLKYSFLTRYMN